MADNAAAQLREHILLLTERCPHEVSFDACPFRRLGGLTWTTRRSLFDRLDLAALTTLFDLTEPCRCPSDPRRHAIGPGAST